MSWKGVLGVREDQLRRLQLSPVSLSQKLRATDKAGCDVSHMKYQLSQGVELLDPLA